MCIETPRAAAEKQFKNVNQKANQYKGEKKQKNKNLCLMSKKRQDRKKKERKK